MRSKSKPKGKSIQDLKEEIDILDVIFHLGSQPRKVSTNWTPCICPFHMDTTASAAVNSLIGRFHCHACDVSGDILDVAQKHLDSDIRTAMTWLEDNFC